MLLPCACARRRLLVIVCIAALLVTGCSAERAEDQLNRLLAAVPQQAAERGVFVSLGGADEGFGSVLPLEGLRSALDIGSVIAVAETGGAPLTVLIGEIAAADVRDAAAGRGFAAREIAGWVVLRQDEQGADPLLSAVPAAAVRDGLLVLGSAEEVAAVVDGAPSAATVPWIARSGEALAEGGRALAFGPAPQRFDDAAAAQGSDVSSLLSAAGARGELAPYEGYVLTWAPGGEGALVLVHDPDTATAAHAEALALRAATGPVLGEGRRSAADLLTGRAPRSDRATGLVTLPVSWRTDDLERLRTDVAAGRLVFLAPG
jgi:hypothetical protein